MFNIACGLAHRVPLTKLIQLDGDVCLYLTALIVAALAWVSKALLMPEGMQIMMISREAFGYMMLEASHNNDNYGLVSS